MNGNTTTGGGGMNTASAPLAENEHVKELLGILRDNGKDAAGLNALLDHVKGMEDFVKKAESKIEDMKSQLEEMKEIQNHPIKTALQNTIKSLEAKVSEIKAHLAELKSNIIEGCKNAVTAFKEKGIGALNNLASFFKIKSGLEAIKSDSIGAISLSDKAVAKIESFSKEYHMSGRHIKNMGRIMIGKKPIDAVKESGILAKAFSAPYKASKDINIAIVNQVNKMIAGLDNLKQKAEAQRDTRASSDKKPTLFERLSEKKELIKQKELETPKLERVPKVKGLEV